MKPNDKYVVATNPLDYPKWKRGDIITYQWTENRHDLGGITQVYHLFRGPGAGGRTMIVHPFDISHVISLAEMYWIKRG